MADEVNLLDVVALTVDMPDHQLHRGEVGTVVERHPNHAFEVEFVAEDGYTYALVTLREDQIVPLRHKAHHAAEHSTVQGWVDALYGSAKPKGVVDELIRERREDNGNE